MKKILAFILYVVMWFGPLWYKLRYLFIKPIKTETRRLSLTELKTEIVHLQKNFSYKHDGAKELADAIVSPDYAYHQLKHSTLYDDCDGFHAGIYELIRNAEYKTCLITSLNESVMSNHVMVLFKYNRILYLVNYSNVITLFSLDDITSESFDKKLEIACTKACGSQSHFRFGLVFTKHRWFKRVSIFKHFKGM